MADQPVTVPLDHIEQPRNRLGGHVEIPYRLNGEVDTGDRTANLVRRNRKKLVSGPECLLGVAKHVSEGALLSPGLRPVRQC